MTTRSPRCPYVITGTTYVPPDDRNRSIRSQPFTGRVVQALIDHCTSFHW